MTPPSPQLPLEQFRRAVVTSDESEPIVAVAKKLRDEHVGCVVVTRDRRPVGILTDRDVALRVVAERRDAERTHASDVTTYGPFVVTATDTVETAIALMREHGVRRLPIVDADGRVTGIITADDLMMVLGRDLAGLACELENQSDASDSR
jgi:CBS domain-containing protein